MEKEEEKKVPVADVAKYQKLNGYISILFEIIIIIFAFFAALPILIILSFPIFIILTIYEQRANICPKQYSRYIFLINILGFLAYFCFWVLSLIFLTVQFIIFLLLTFLSLQVFASKEYFRKENVLIVQHILTVAMLLLIVYSWFPLFSTEYINFPANTFVVTLANTFIHVIINLVVFLISFYYLFARHFRRNPWKNFNSIIILNILLIEIVAYILINFKNYYTLELSLFVNNVIFSLLIFPIIFIVFLFVNYLVGIFDKEYSLKQCYYSCWVMSSIIAFTLFYSFWGNITVFMLTCLFISFSTYLILRFGFKINKIQEHTLQKFSIWNSYVIFIELFILLFNLYYNFLSSVAGYLEIFSVIIFSGYLSFLSINVIILVISKTQIIPKKQRILLLDIALLYTTFIVSYFSILFTVGSYFIFNIPALTTCLILFLPLFIIKKRVENKEIIKSLIRINTIVLSIALLLFPMLTHLELQLLTSILSLFNVINFTLYIFFGIISILSLSSKRLKIREKRIELMIKSQILIGFIIAFTTVFFYSYHYLSFTLPNLSIVLPLLFSLLYLYIPARIAYKKEIFNENIMRILIRVNSYIVYIDIFFLSYSFFITIFEFLGLYSIIVSLYLSVIVINFINILFFRLDLISKAFKIICWEITLLFTSYLVFYVTYQYVNGTYYVINIPVLFSSIVFYWPILFLKSRIRFKKLIKIMVKITSYVLSVSILLFPTVISLELTNLGFELNYVTIFNFTLYILYVILGFLLVIARSLHFTGRKSLILKTQVFIEFVISISTVFYYSFIFLSGTTLSYILPLLFTSIFLFLPSFSSYKRGFFNTKVLKSIIIVNSLLFWACIIAIPSIITLEISFNFAILVSISLLLLFFAIKYFDLISVYLGFKDSLIMSIKLMGITVWFLFSVLVTYSCFSLFFGGSEIYLSNLIIGSGITLFFILNLINLPLIENLKQHIFESETSRLDYYKIYKIYEFIKNLIIFGTLTSISFILTTFVQLIDVIQAFIQGGFVYFDILFFLVVYFLIFLILLNVFQAFIKIDYVRVKEYLELSCWLVLKSLIIAIFALFPLEITLVNRILLLVLIFSVLSPITLNYISEKVIVFESTLILLRKIIAVLFFFSILGVYIELLLNFSGIFGIITGYQNFIEFFVICKVIIFIYFYLSRFNDYNEGQAKFRIYILMLYSIIFIGVFSLLQQFLYVIGTLIFIAPVLSIIGLIIVLKKRSRNIILRFFSYFIVSIIIYLEIGGMFGLLDGFNSILFMNSISVTLFLSILSNLKRINNIEKFTLYISLSILSFIWLFPIIPILYNLTISLLIYSSLMAVFFYRKKDKRYKWFIKPCVLLAVFDFISFMSYSVFFNNAVYQDYNLILSLTLTLAVTGFLFIFLYNDSPQLFRKRSFYFVLTSNIISLPLFIYFLLIVTYGLPLFSLEIFENLVILTISINIAIFLFYLSIAIYQWKLSKAIWSIGYRIWILLPLANYLLISKAFTGVDIITNAVNFFGVNLYGSNIIAFVICLLISLPFWYTWIKKNFNNVLLIIWGLSLILIYWFSQNAFFYNIFLFALSFVGISLILLIPILIRIKIWSIASILWTSFSIIMLFFLTTFLSIIGLSPLFNASITTIAGGIMGIILSFFPSLRAQKNVILGISYIASISGIFLIVFSLLYAITLQLWISIFISLIILAFSLYTSRVLKLNKIFFDRLISSILIVSFTGLTFFTLNLIPDFELLSIYLSLTVCGGSFFVFNYYRMFIPSKKVIPLTILSLGLSLTASTLWQMFLPFSLFIIAAIFILINLFFLSIALVKRRYILWFLNPIPITLLILHPLSYIEILQPLIIFIIISLMVYTLIFQIFLNLGSKTSKRILQSKLLNLVCFILNSIYFSIVISYLSPISLIYQILEGLIIGSVLILFSTAYMNKVRIDFEIENFRTILNRFISIITLLLYLEIFLLSFGLISDYTSLGISENIFISSSILWFLTLLDLSWFNRVSKKIAYPINYCMFFLISIFGWIYFYEYTLLGLEYLFLNIIVLLTMQYYSIHAIFAHLKYIGKFDSELLDNKKKQIRSFLSNSIFIIMDLYVSALFTSILVNFNPILAGVPSLIFSIMIFTGILFLLNNFIKYPGRNIILWILYLLFQGCLTLFYLFIVNTLFVMNEFNLISLIILNTLMMFYNVYAARKIFTLSKEFVHNINAIIVLFLYLEISALSFGIGMLYFGLLESITISQLTLTIITFIDLYLIKRIQRKYIFIVHIISYFALSVLGFIYFYEFISIGFEILFLNILVLLIMQYYSIYAIFAHLKYIGKYDLTSLVSKRRQIRSILTNSMFVTIDLYLSSLFTSILVDNFPSFMGMTSISFFIMFFTLFLFILNNIIKYQGKNMVIWILFMVFQASFSLFYYFALDALSLINIFSLVSLLLLNTFMLFYSVFSISRIFNVSKESVHRSNSIIVLLSYFEISLLFYGLAKIFLLGDFESLIISQLTLFATSLLELVIVKRISRKYILIIHTFSYFISSALGFVFLVNLVPLNFTLQSLMIIGFCFVQFYTNYSYYNIRRAFNTEKEEKFRKWSIVRKNILGSVIYITIGNFIWQFLISSGNSPYSSLVILSLFMHFIMVLDKFVLKFLGKIAIYTMFGFWILILGFGLLYSVELVSIFSQVIIPVIVIVFILGLAYGYWIKLFEVWKPLSQNKSKIKNFLIILTYLNFITWPIYYITLDIVNILTIALFVFGITFIIALIDKSISALRETIRKNLVKVSIFCFGTIFSVELYFLLDVVLQTQKPILNLSVSFLSFLIFPGYLIKPFKKHGWLAFLYWTGIFLLMSVILNQIYLTGITWSILVIGVLLYPFFFLLEELKRFITKLIDNFALILRKIGQAIGRFITGFFNFLKKHYKGLRVIICILSGIMITVLVYMSGIVRSIPVLANHELLISLLSGLGGFGLLNSILPSKKSEDYDEIFKHRMTRFISGWSGMTAFIYIFILQFQIITGESPLLSVSILLGLFLMLGAIILLYIYRLEEKARISILWRFYTLIFFFIILAIEIIIVIILNIF